jgi:hypothetical protein
MLTGVSIYAFYRKRLCGLYLESDHNTKILKNHCPRLPVVFLNHYILSIPPPSYVTHTFSQNTKFSLELGESTKGSYCLLHFKFQFEKIKNILETEW